MAQCKPRKDFLPQEAAPWAPIPAGFTLVELMVVLALILLISAVTLPSVTSIFQSGARAMAFNQLDAQLEGSRMLAKEMGTPLGVHAQLADPVTRPNLRDVQYTTVVIYNDDPKDDQDNDLPQYQKFTQAAGLVPRALPRPMALGDADNSDCRDDGTWKAITDEQLSGEFTTFSIIFSSMGMPVTKVNGQDPEFYAAEGHDGLFSGTTQLWVLPDPKPATRAITIFDFSAVHPMSPADRQAYLNESGQYIPVNHHTGRLYRRKSP